MDDKDEMFTSKTFSFLEELSKGKNKKWFDEHRDIYQDHLVAPLRDLVVGVSSTLLSLNKSFEVTPQFNKTLTRINRDMRFARKDNLYKDHMLILLYRKGRKREDAQLFFGLLRKVIWSGLYISPQLQGPTSPIAKFTKSKPGKLAEIGRRCGIGKKYDICICESLGRVENLMPGTEDSDYMVGSHLAIVRTQKPEQIIRLGHQVINDFSDTIRDLYPLWAIYSGAK